MNYYNSKIGIMIPVRDRGKILPYTLNSILKMDYDKKNIGIRFLVNDSSDNTEEIVDNFISENKDSYFKCDKYVLNTGMREDNRRDRRPTILDHMAFLKNVLFCSMIKDGYDFIFFMDSDLILPNNLLKFLVSENNEMSAPMINIIPYTLRYRPNGEEIVEKKENYNFFNYNPTRKKYKRQSFCDKPIITDYVCGCFLIKNTLFDIVRFGFEEELGDDDTFMRLIRKNGSKIKMYPFPEIEHVFYVERWLKENGTKK